MIQISINVVCLLVTATTMVYYHRKFKRQKKLYEAKDRIQVEIIAQQITHINMEEIDKMPYEVLLNYSMALKEKIMGMNRDEIMEAIKEVAEGEKQEKSSQD